MQEDVWTYIATNILPSDVLGTSPKYDGCDCSVASCSSSTCGCIQAHGYVYAEQNRLHSIPPSVPIFECNSACACSSTCINRLTQRIPPRNAFHVQSFPEKGLGLAKNTPILSGEFLMEYMGEVLSAEEVQYRRKTCCSSSNTTTTTFFNNYVLCLREHTLKGILVTYIDASRYGNLSRYINHSCEPNLILVPVRRDYPSIPSMAFFAARDIKAGEELTFSYGDVKVLQAGEEEEEEKKEVRGGMKRKLCHCGSIHCKGWLPLDPSTA